MSEDRTFLLNRLWNLKVELAQLYIVDLESLARFLELDEFKFDGLTISVAGVLEALFLAFLGRTKVIGGKDKEDKKSLSRYEDFTSITLSSDIEEGVEENDD
jgi:hypothetical protein